MRPWYDDHTLWCDNGDSQAKVCEHQGCAQEGSHRAPFSPQELNRYRWFCLDHVKAYNASWDFAKGLGPEEIERVIRFDTTWQRETQPLGNWRMKENLIRARARHFAAGFEPQPSSGRSSHHPPKVVAALATLELDVMPDADTLQVKYRALVKQYHPDTHGGDKKLEEKLKQINHAYAVLKEFLR